jgi:GNAT superfamily N-acetyltransferase
MPDLKLTRDFAPNPLHGYNLPPDTEVQSAKFGRIRVDVWRDPEPSTVFRGDPPRPVGVWPDRNWRYVVHGVMSGVAATEAGAKSRGEITAWRNQPNAPTVFDGEALVFAPNLLRHQISVGEMAIDEGVLATQRALIMAHFPAERATETDSQEFRISQHADLTARVTRVIRFGPDPVLALLSRTGEDGSPRDLIACALPETDGRGWAYVVSEPTPDSMADWNREAIDLRTLQLDPQTAHYVTRDAGGMSETGSEVRLVKIKGGIPEAWLPDPGVHARMFENDNHNPSDDGIEPRDGPEMTSADLELDPDRPIRDAVRSAFHVPDGVRVRLHRGGRPAWFLEMAWDGTETVGCGDRFFGEPEPDGFSLVASLNGHPAGYLSAEISPGAQGGGAVHVEMVQVDADHRGVRIGSALAAGLAELLLRQMDTGPEAAPLTVTADTGSVAAHRLIARLEQVLDEAFEARIDQSGAKEGPARVLAVRESGGRDLPVGRFVMTEQGLRPDFGPENGPEIEHHIRIVRDLNGAIGSLTSVTCVFEEEHGSDNESPEP